MIVVVALLALAAAGMAVNSWGHYIGLRFRTAHPSIGTFLVGHTPNCAYVRWNKDSSPPTGFDTETPYKLIVLTDADDTFLLYERPFDNRPRRPDKPADDRRYCANLSPNSDEHHPTRLADLVYKVSADDVQVDRIPKDT